MDENLFNIKSVFIKYYLLNIKNLFNIKSTSTNKIFYIDLLK